MNRGRIPQTEKHQRVWDAYMRGDKLENIGKRFRFSRQRVNQIIVREAARRGVPRPRRRAPKGQGDAWR